MSGATTVERPSQSLRILELQAWLTRRRFNVAVMLAVQKMREEGESRPIHELATCMEMSHRHFWRCRMKRVDISPRTLLWIDRAFVEVIGDDWIQRVAAVEVQV